LFLVVNFLKYVATAHRNSVKSDDHITLKRSLSLYILSTM